MEFLSYDIESNDFRRAGAASRAIKEHLKRIGAEAEAIRRTMIAAYEAEMNAVIHSTGGRLEACLSASQIDVSVVDGGPGIPDVEQAMVEGFSTAGPEARALGFGAGMGLPNIKRNSDRLRVTSRMGEGTRVSFTVYLLPESTDGARPISLYASADRCRDCRACLTACPTQAMRVRDGRPSVLEHLCIDCTACIAACSSAALTMRDQLSSLAALPGKEDMLLVVPPALLAGFGADYPPAQVLAALQGLGFADVITSGPYEQALRAAVGTAPAEGATGGAAPTGAAARPQPLISSSCPAIVNLVELRFPSLVPHLAPFDSPWEAAQAAHSDRPVAYVVSCPSQRSALLLQAQGAPGQGGSDRGAAGATAEYLAPGTLRQAVMMKLTGGAGSDPEPHSEAAADPTPTHTPATLADAGGTDLLTVTGIAHVIAVLEQIEDGLLGDVTAIDPYACEGGCFGSPLLFEDHHVAARRWERGRAAVEAAEAAVDGDGAGAAGPPSRPAPAPQPRRRPFGARPGIRLDADMGKAIQKLGHLQQVIHSLPGRDCGTCGAPTCAALAEDVVMQRAGVELCPHTARENGDKEDRDQ
jgi:anti-sigma regulatory factor (Ser/Thr protein kinase)/Na+-translocating ferredoxin:NAD+ oxidoreductase RNF subunit RnfB